jgi:hypothetical protein
MLQRDSLPTVVPTDISDSLQRTLDRRWSDVLQEILWLPDNYRQYLIVLVVSLAIGAGMMMQVWLSMQIAEQRYLLRELTEKRQQIERENSEIVYAIANTTSLRQIEQSALAQGYRPTINRKYIRRDELAVSSAPSIAEIPAQPMSEAPGRPSFTEKVLTPSTQSSDLIDAVGRGLGAAGEWLEQQARSASGALGGLAAGFTERWMR